MFVHRIRLLQGGMLQNDVWIFLAKTAAITVAKGWLRGVSLPPLKPQVLAGCIAGKLSFFARKNTASNDLSPIDLDLRWFLGIKEGWPQHVSWGFWSFCHIKILNIMIFLNEFHLPLFWGRVDDLTTGSLPPSKKGKATEENPPTWLFV